MTKKEQFLEYAKEIKSLGYRVFVIKRNDSNYGWVVNDKDEIGHFQLGDYGYGVTFSTMHYGTRSMGTGFGLDNWDEAHTTFTRRLVDRCFVRVPHFCYETGWCRTREELEDLNRVKKYKFSEWIKTYWDKENVEEI